MDLLLEGLFVVRFIRGAHQDRNPRSTDKRVPISPHRPVHSNVHKCGWKWLARARGIRTLFSESRRLLPIKNIVCDEVGWWVGKKQSTHKSGLDCTQSPAPSMKAARLLHGRDERRRKKLVDEHKPEAGPDELAPSTRYSSTTDEDFSAAASSDCSSMGRPTRPSARSSDDRPREITFFIRAHPWR